MIRYFVHRDGATQVVDSIDPAWLREGSGITVWADVAAPTPADGAVLGEVFGLHDLAVADALEETHHPKVETTASIAD